MEVVKAMPDGQEKEGGGVTPAIYIYIVAENGVSLGISK
jgi:hypothetical protein